MKRRDFLKRLLATIAAATAPMNVNSASKRFKKDEEVWHHSASAFTSNSTREVYLDGTKIEFAEWDVLLTDAEIEAINEGVDPRYIRPNSLVSYTPQYYH